MTLTDPHRSTVRERLRPVIGDDSALEALMSTIPADEAHEPVTKAHLDSVLDVRLSAMEARLTTMVHDSQTRMLGILLAFTTAYLAIVVGAVLALK